MKTQRGRCRCGAVLLFIEDANGYKTRCSNCGAVVRLRPPAPAAAPTTPAPEGRRHINCSCGTLVTVINGKPTICPFCRLPLPAANQPPAPRPAPARAPAPVVPPPADDDEIYDAESVEPTTQTRPTQPTQQNTSLPVEVLDEDEGEPVELLEDDEEEAPPVRRPVRQPVRRVVGRPLKGKVKDVEDVEDVEEV